jgi:hypothetical protein
VQNGIQILSKLITEDGKIENQIFLNIFALPTYLIFKVVSPSFYTKNKTF